MQMRDDIRIQKARARWQRVNQSINAGYARRNTSSLCSLVSSERRAAARGWAHLPGDIPRELCEDHYADMGQAVQLQCHQCVARVTIRIGAHKGELMRGLLPLPGAIMLLNTLITDQMLQPQSFHLGPFSTFVS